MAKFSDLNLKKDVLNVLAGLKLKEPLEVQVKSIPPILKGKNVVFQSQTGSGKTLAFTIGFLSRLNKKLGLQMVVLVPTRELCMQVGKEMRTVCEPLGLNVGIMYGGRNPKQDYKIYKKKNHVMVATPGRFLTHVNEKSVRVGEVRFLVYDECDEMFDKGFYDDCVYLKSRVSTDVQTILSSATLSDDVQRFIDQYIGKHEMIKVGEQVSDNIVQEKIFCKIPDKNAVLGKILKEKFFQRCLIFCNAKNRLENVVEYLKKHHYKVKPISSDYEQKQRESYLDLFLKGKVKILVATDVAARGLHIENVDIVVNYDIPSNSKFYIHRIGRTGRLGKKGYAVSLVCPEDEGRFEDIVFEYLHDFKILEKKEK